VHKAKTYTKTPVFQGVPQVINTYGSTDFLEPTGAGAQNVHVHLVSTVLTDHTKLIASCLNYWMWLLWTCVNLVLLPC